MNHQCERLIGILSQPIKSRRIEEIRLVSDWLRDTIPCLRTVESGIVHEVVRLGLYKKCLRDEAIVRSGQKDDGVYIILSGVASAYLRQKHRDFASEVSAINEAVEEAETNITTDTTNNTTVEITITTDTVDASSTGSVDGEPPLARRQSTPEVKQPEAVVSRSISVNRKSTPDKLDREKLGKPVAKFSVGKCLGRAAQRADDSLRNATVLSDDVVHLLHLSQEVYDQTIKPSMEQELTFRRKFIELHPAFACSSPKVKQLLETMLTKEFYPSGQPIVRQGDRYAGLVFILSGQANIVVEPDKHRTQYDDHLEAYTNQSEETQNETAAKRSRRSDSSPNRSPPNLDPIRLRRRHGYAAAERRLRSRLLTVCSVERGEIVGDVELVAGLDTYCQTITPTDPVDAYVLTVKNIDRIGSKAFSESMNVLRVEVETKLTNRMERLKDHGPPLFPRLLAKLRFRDEERPVDLPPLVSTKTLPTNEELFQHLLKSFVENRSALCQPYVSGSVFYRDMMRTKAVLRRSAPEALKPTGRPAARLKVLLGPLKPLTKRAIKVALKRQEDELEKVEETARLHEMRCMELARTRNECEKVSLDYHQLGAGTPPLTEKAMMHMQQVLLNQLRRHSRQNGDLPIDPETDLRTSPSKAVPTTDPFKILLHPTGPSKTPAALPAIKASDSRDFEAEKPRATPSIESGMLDSPKRSDRTVPTSNDEHKKGAEENQTEIKSFTLTENDTERQQNGTKSKAIETDMAIRQDNVYQAVSHTGTRKEGTEPPNGKANSAELENTSNEASITAGVLLESADKITLQLERTKTLLSELDRRSEPADLQTDHDGPKGDREVHSARAELHLPQRRNPVSTEQMMAETRRMKEAVVLTIAKELCEERARNRLNKDLVSAEDVLYESPSYRDWETSDRSLNYLEERIARFYAETTTGKATKPSQLPKLRRFEPTDDQPKHAAPGGKVYVKRRACDARRTNGAAVTNHDHVRYHLLPSIPNYDQLRTSKMVMFQLLDDARQQWINEH